MTLDLLFVICNAGVVPFWILLAVAPTWKWTQRLVHSALLPAVFGLIYVALITTAVVLSVRLSLPLASRMLQLARSCVHSCDGKPPRHCAG